MLLPPPRNYLVQTKDIFVQHVTRNRFGFLVWPRIGNAKNAIGLLPFGGVLYIEDFQAGISIHELLHTPLSSRHTLPIDQASLPLFSVFVELSTLIKEAITLYVCPMYCFARKYNASSQYTN